MILITCKKYRQNVIYKQILSASLDKLEFQEKKIQIDMRRTLWDPINDCEY